jgi:hypothetical protein
MDGSKGGYMPNMERVREEVAGPITPAHLDERVRDGWKLVAMEWEREAASDARGSRVAVPYGLRIADDAKYLEEDPDEKAVIIAALDMIIQDCGMTRVARELNGLGYRTRAGAPWTAAAVFDLLPRMIEAGPRIFTSPEWTERIRRLINVL